MKIKKLPSDLIDKIAAGEVVERPASVVKELVENALDAKAAFVEVSVVSGGKDSILVRDDGAGMSRDDAKEAFQRHSTSKLSSVEDLTAIETFGFRGEALSSIAAVSKVTLQTKEPDSVEGTEVVLEGGKIKDVSSCAHPEGTTVKVCDLFYNVPARRKFLKTTRTELRHIREWLTAQALAYPEIGFSLSHNGKDKFYFSAGQSQEDRIEKVVGSLDDFAAVSGEQTYLNLEGFVSLPRKARKRRKHQYLYVNGRYLSNRTVSGALRKVYDELLPKSLYPQYILFLNIREDLVDVNVHPRKEEIKFINSSEVFNLVLNSVKTALSRSLESAPSGFSVARSDSAGAVSGNIRKAGLARDSKGASLPRSRRDYVAEPLEFPQKLEDQELPTEELSMWQIANLYLVIAEQDGVLVIDQHAAEERILLEKFLKHYKDQEKRGQGQKLLITRALELDREDFNTLQDNKEILEGLGFEFELNEDDTVQLLAVPSVLVDREIESIFYGFLDDLSGNQDFEKSEIEVSSQVYNVLATLACRSAVKKGDRLSFRERKNIVDRLQNLGSRGATCPHGRPTWIKFSLSKLDKMFKRT